MKILHDARGAFGRKGVMLNARRQFAIQRRNVRKPTPEDDGIGIENIDDARNGTRKAVVENIHHLGGCFASRFRGVGDFAGGQVATRCRQKLPLQGRSAAPCFDAAGTAAIAGGARNLIGVRAGQRIVTPFAGDEMGAGNRASANADATTDSGSGNDTEDDIGAGRSAIHSFGEREAVGIVGDTHAQRQPAAGIERGDLDLRAAKVDTEAHGQSALASLARMNASASRQLSARRWAWGEGASSGFSRSSPIRCRRNTSGAASVAEARCCGMSSIKNVGLAARAASPFTAGPFGPLFTINGKGRFNLTKFRNRAGACASDTFERTTMLIAGASPLNTSQASSTASSQSRSSRNASSKAVTSTSSSTVWSSSRFTLPCSR